MTTQPPVTQQNNEPQPRHNLPQPSREDFRYVEFFAPIARGISRRQNEGWLTLPVHANLMMEWFPRALCNPLQERELQRSKIKGGYDDLAVSAASWPWLGQFCVYARERFQ